MTSKPEVFLIERRPALYVKTAVEEIALDGPSGTSLPRLWQLLEKRFPGCAPDQFTKAYLFRQLVNAPAVRVAISHSTTTSGKKKSTQAQQRQQSLTPNLLATMSIDEVEQQHASVRLLAVESLQNRLILGSSPQIRGSLSEQNWKALVAITRSRHGGVTQADLAKQLNADSRSMPHILKPLLTSLVYKYPVISKGALTNILIHQRFRPSGEDEDGDDVNDDDEEHVAAVVSGASGSGPAAVGQDINGFDVISYRVKICELLAAAKNRTIALKDLRQTVGLRDRLMTARFKRIVMYLNNHGFIEKINVRHEDEIVRCVRLLRLYAPERGADAFVSAFKTVKSAGDSASSATTSATPAGQSEQARGALIDMDLTHQMFRMIVESGPYGITSSEIISRLGNIYRKLVEKNLDCLFRSKRSGSNVSKLAEAVGKERRFRYYAGQFYGQRQLLERPKAAVGKQQQPPKLEEIEASSESTSVASPANKPPQVAAPSSPVGPQRSNDEELFANAHTLATLGSLLVVGENVDTTNVAATASAASTARHEHVDGIIAIPMDQLPRILFQPVSIMGGRDTENSMERRKKMFLLVKSYGAIEMGVPLINLFVEHFCNQSSDQPPPDRKTVNRMVKVLELQRLVNTCTLQIERVTSSAMDRRTIVYDAELSREDPKVRDLIESIKNRIWTVASRAGTGAGGTDGVSVASEIVEMEIDRLTAGTEETVIGKAAKEKQTAKAPGEWHRYASEFGYMRSIMLRVRTLHFFLFNLLTENSGNQHDDYDRCETEDFDPELFVGCFNQTQLYRLIPLYLYLQIVGHRMEDEELRQFIDQDKQRNLLLPLVRIPATIASRIYQHGLQRIRDSIGRLIDLLIHLGLVERRAATIISIDPTVQRGAAVAPSVFLLSRYASVFDYKQPDRPLKQRYKLDDAVALSRFWLQLKSVCVGDQLNQRRLAGSDGSGDEEDQEEPPEIDSDIEEEVNEEEQKDAAGAGQVVGSGDKRLLKSILAPLNWITSGFSFDHLSIMRHHIRNAEHSGEKHPYFDPDQIKRWAAEFHVSKSKLLIYLRADYRRTGKPLPKMQGNAAAAAKALKKEKQSDEQRRLSGPATPPATADFLRERRRQAAGQKTILGLLARTVEAQLPLEPPRTLHAVLPTTLEELQMIAGAESATEQQQQPAPPPQKPKASIGKLRRVRGLQDVAEAPKSAVLQSGFPVKQQQHRTRREWTEEEDELITLGVAIIKARMQRFNLSQRIDWALFEGFLSSKVSPNLCRRRFCKHWVDLKYRNRVQYLVNEWEKLRPQCLANGEFDDKVNMENAYDFDFQAEVSALRRAHLLSTSPIDISDKGRSGGVSQLPSTIEELLARFTVKEFQVGGIEAPNTSQRSRLLQLLRHSNAIPRKLKIAEQLHSSREIIRTLIKNILLTDEKDYSAQAANELLATVDSEEFIDTFNEMKESGELADVKGGQARRLFSRGVQLSVKALRPITKTSWVSALQRARQIFQKIVVPSISELSLDCPGGEILAYTCLAFTRKSPQPPVLKLLPKFAELSQRQWEDVFAEGSNEEIYLAVQLRFDENNLGLLFPASPPAASNNRKDTVLPVTSRRIWHDISGKFDGKNFQSICDCVLAVLMESPALTEDELLSKFEPLLSSFDLTGILEYLLKSGAICAEPITLQQPQSIVYQLNPINFIYKSVAPTAY